MPKTVSPGSIMPPGYAYPPSSVREMTTTWRFPESGRGTREGRRVFVGGTRTMRLTHLHIRWLVWKLWHQATGQGDIQCAMLAGMIEPRGTVFDIYTRRPHKKSCFYTLIFTKWAFASFQSQVTIDEYIVMFVTLGFS